MLLLASAAGAEPPVVEYQPVPCTVAGRPFRLCASITDDGQVAKARIYFRQARERYYNYVEMSFEGLNFCGTLPAPREGKLREIEYYVQGIDDQYESKRSNTYVLQVQPEGACEFAPVERDAARAQAITVYATSRKQGKNLPDEFQRDGVSFVPAQGN